MSDTPHTRASPATGEAFPGPDQSVDEMFAGVPAAAIVEAPTGVAEGRERGARLPLLAEYRPDGPQLLVKVFVAVPTLALITAVALAWGWALSITDIALAVAFYLVGALGITAGYHRYFTHRAFKANRALRIGLAMAGAIAFQGSIITWVADHRRHHTFTDKQGDPTRRGSTAPRLRRWPGASGTRTWDGSSTATKPTPPGSLLTCSPIPTSPASTARPSVGGRSAWPRPRHWAG